ncbi:pyridoxal phosphate-dependent aminotransferase [Diplocloster hominis]|uniref:pyridoxal phosphate-dependent aminotransferase n=1 Tax=Diplocloster hominis TaxID=3079010 RepID=UPI0031B9EA69
MAVKIAKRYRGVEGGLFSKVTKADVGDSFASMEGQVTLMGWADPFYPDPAIPEHIQKVLIDTVKTGFPAHYTMPSGSLELRQELAEKLKNFNQISADPRRNIIITPGSDSGLFFAMSAFIGPGDEVLVPDPSYPNNFLNVQLLGAAAVPVPLDRERGYQLDVDAFARAVTDKTKAIVLTHPNNPTTTVFRREGLEALARLVVEKDLALIVDQAFEDSVFDGVEYVSPAALPGMWERTVTVCSISKGMGLSGFRVGYLVADDRVMDVFHGAAVNVLGATNTLSQIAAVEAFRHPEFLEENIRAFGRRRDMAWEELSGVPGVHMYRPESAFYCWLDVSALGDSTEIVDRILREAGVAVNDGKAYGSQGAGCLRIIHGCLGDEEAARDALKRIANVLTVIAQEREVKQGNTLLGK